MYGYIGQTDINIYERTIIVTLIARKSVKNAGPRFYKRGLTFDGYVANEIETEQIVTDNTLLSYGLRKSSSYVQLRGSAPFFWSHFTTEKQNLVCAKPPILVNVVDPYHRSAAIHFNRIFKRYGIPIICLNLVKQSKNNNQDAFITEYFRGCVDYLNTFLPTDYKIEYHEFDMSAHRKRCDDPDKNLVLENLISKIFTKTDIFYQKDNKTQLQNGIIRVNCVDCLDRTNVAQYLVGLHAISQQLNILEIVPDSLITDSKIISILRNLYTAHGDALASQNTGSHMAHRMEAYFEKSSVMTDHSRDMYQTLTRYYQNNFQDFEKQSATNLFLGVYVPYLSQEKNIKNIFNDFILHSPWKTRYKIISKYNLRKWWDIPFINQTRIVASKNDDDFIDMSDSELILVPYGDSLTDLNTNCIKKQRIFDIDNNDLTCVKNENRSKTNDIKNNDLFNSTNSLISIEDIIMNIFPVSLYFDKYSTKQEYIETAHKTYLDYLNLKSLIDGNYFCIHKDNYKYYEDYMNYKDVAS